MEEDSIKGRRHSPLSKNKTKKNQAQGTSKDGLDFNVTENICFLLTLQLHEGCK